MAAAKAAAKRRSRGEGSVDSYKTKAGLRFTGKPR